jgi:peptidoglycan LD-endopeptidase LytH
MSTFRQKARRIAASIYLILLHGLALFLIAERFAPAWVSFLHPTETNVTDPTEHPPVPTPLPVPSLLSHLDPEPAASPVVNALPGNGVPDGGLLLVPVAGVRPDQLVDTFTQARSEGRVHEAIDIPATVGTPVVAAADGTIVKFWDSQRGGITIYQLSSDQKYFYYYAHLQRRSDQIKEGDFVKRGTTIGFVGDTGNAGAGNYHLHFGVSIVSDPKRYWDGTSVNPYSLLHGPANENKPSNAP